MAKHLLDVKNSILLVIDIQEKFLPIIPAGECLVRKAQALIEAAKVLNIPIIVSEQYPKGLGHTAQALRDILPADAVVREKTAFGCMKDKGLAACVKSSGKKQVVVCGVEAHVCVNQTVHQLLEAGFEVHVAEDALASRDDANREIALTKMRRSGSIPSCVEMILFEWMEHSKHPEFKRIQALIK